MVSTRGVRVKFSEGERVLCYEPDPTKAKVLYDSKVLQVVHTKDAKGRKQVEYLIHFQGWNASWDRRVTEDFVLRDTEENRELQKQLAEKAHIKLSIKSNRVLLGSGSSSGVRRRRRRLSETIRETIERERKNKAESDDTSSQTGTATTEDDMESLSSSGLGSTTNNDQEEDEEEDELSDEETIAKHVPLVIPDPLRGVIEKDFFFINEKNKLLNLPSNKCVLSVLEDYVRFFALRYMARTRDKRRSEPKDKERSFMTLDLCKEVVDGIRICFDFYLHPLLLYPRERLQAEKLKKAHPLDVDSYVSDSLPPANSTLSKESLEETKDVKSPSKVKEEKKVSVVEVTPRRILRSKRPQVEEISHGLSTEPSRSQQHSQPQLQSHVPQQHQQGQSQQSVACESGRSTPTTLTSGTSAPDGVVSFPLTEGNLLSLPHQFRSLANWTLLPESHRKPPTPVLLYGPMHLLRLFVKMPEILYRMNLPGDRKKVILHHIDLFLEYLCLHISDFFSDSNYTNYVEV